MSPAGDLVADTISGRTELGLAITGAAGVETTTIIEAFPITGDSHCFAVWKWWYLLGFYGAVAGVGDIRDSEPYGAG
ncbi:hypothetical protein M0E87_12345, partial [Corynebacterium sp. CCM 9185]|nr:hypothetical protein [Corynebacterium marambiense]